MVYKDHRYKQEKIERFKFKFDGYDTIFENFSHAYQDIFALAANDGKRDGTFLEIGGFHPIQDSNTNVPEKLFNWKGISIDIVNVGHAFSIHRPRTQFVHANAVTLDYDKLLSENGYSNRIDYLSLDIEPPIQTFNALKQLPLDKYRFSVITYETDYYRDFNYRDMVRTESRKLLDSHGYIRVNGNVSYLNDTTPFEDWYLDSQYFTKEQINKFMREDDTPLNAEDYIFEKE